MRSSYKLYSRRASLLGGTWLMLSAAAAAAQTTAAVPLVTSHLSEGVVHYRLVPLAGAKVPRTAAWTIERKFSTYRGNPVVIQVTTVGPSGHETIDSILFEHVTARPVWEHVHGGMTTMLAFAGKHVTGRVMQKGSADRAISLTTTVPSFSGSIDDVVVQSVPLVRGYTVVLPFVGGDAVEVDTIHVRERERVSTATGAHDAWAVDLRYPSGSETLWIDPTTRAILRHIYTLKDRSQLEVVTN